MKSGSGILYSFKNNILSAYYVLGTVLNSGYIALKAMYILEETDNKQVIRL